MAACARDSRVATVMNYLAHLLLADGSPESLVGGLLGDFAKGLDLAGLPAPMMQALMAHRRIDAFTDAHEFVRRSRARISPKYSRFAGILVDVFYDHFLAVSWTSWSRENLGEFSKRVYAALQIHEALLPTRLAAVLPRMKAEDWLGGYAEIDNIGHALAGLQRRLKRPMELTSALSELRAGYTDLAQDFARFFPELRRFTLNLESAQPL